MNEDWRFFVLIVQATGSHDCVLILAMARVDDISFVEIPLVMDLSSWD